MTDRCTFTYGCPNSPLPGTPYCDSHTGDAPLTSKTGVAQRIDDYLRRHDNTVVTTQSHELLRESYVEIERLREALQYYSDMGGFIGTRAKEALAKQPVETTGE